MSGWIIYYWSCSPIQFMIDDHGSIAPISGIGEGVENKKLSAAYRFQTREAAKAILATSGARWDESKFWEDKEWKSRTRGGDPFWGWVILVEDHAREMVRKLEEEWQRTVALNPGLAHLRNA